MTETQINFADLAERLLSQAREILPQWFPNGKFRGSEFLVGSLAGEAGESLAINVHTGKWADFADRSCRGLDLISLYAAQHNLKQSDAARQLDPQIPRDIKPVSRRESSPREKWRVIVPVPEDASAPPDARSVKLPNGWQRLTFVKRWPYHDESGRLLGYVCRFQKPDGDKDIAPQTFCVSETGKREWKWKAFPKPRPLYGLQDLIQHSKRPVMVVEGEKDTDAAREIVGDRYVVVTWPGGSAAIDLADWRRLYDRPVLLWPDADRKTYPSNHVRAGELMDYWDQPGPAAMRKLAAKLYEYCPDIKIIDVSDQPVDGWGAADALAEGWTWERLFTWAKPRAKKYEPAPVVQIEHEREKRRSDPPAGEAPRTWTSQRMIWEQFGLDLNGHGSPLANLNNALKLLEQHTELQDLVHFDAFYQRYYHRDGREWSDVDELNLTAWIQRTVGIGRMPTSLVHDAAVIVARRRTTNEPRDWMASLTWDQTERIEQFFADAFEAEDNVYTRAASRNFWIAMVARIFRPGCRMRNVVVLEGPQEIGKSTALSLIGGPWYAEATESVMGKDFFQVIQGKLLIEIGELDAFNRAEVTRIKQVISAPTDRFRPPYGRAPADFPRQCVFVGTTNEHEYLKDTTGGTRFWPIKCHAINLPVIRDNREQLFAEAVHKFNAGASWWEMPKVETEREQEERRQVDVWESVIEEWLARNVLTEITLEAVLRSALDISVAKQDKFTQMRAAQVMRALGWEKISKRIRGHVVRLWAKPDRLL